MKTLNFKSTMALLLLVGMIFFSAPMVMAEEVPSDVPAETVLEVTAEDPVEEVLEVLVEEPARGSARGRTC